MNGIFDLSNLDKLGDEDIVPVNEDVEFAPNSNATRDVSTHTTSAKISVPGGDGERPSAKPEGGEHGPTPPGGNSEKPSAKPEGGERGPSAPQKTELTTDQWNRAVASLKQSFKEGYELMELLENCTVVPETVEQRQERYLQESMEIAYYEAMTNGPIFEAVRRDDKHDVKKIVKSVQRRLHDWCDNNHLKYRPAKLWSKAFQISWWNTRLWQVLGAVYVEPGNVKSVVTQINKEFKSELGDYKVISSGVWIPDLIDVFKTKFNWKNQRSIAVLLVDKKLPFEFSRENQLKSVKGKDGPKTESAKDDEDKCPRCGKKECECDDDETCPKYKKESADEDEKEDKKCPKCGKEPCECDKNKKDDEDK